MDNIVNAIFKEGQSGVVYTKRLLQYDRGVTLRISGVALPEKYQVHFSNDEDKGVCTAMWASGSDILIPDAYFETGDYVHVWIYFADENGSKTGASMYRIIIPVEKRPAILTFSGSSGGMVINAELDNESHTLIFH